MSRLNILVDKTFSEPAHMSIIYENSRLSLTTGLFDVHTDCVFLAVYASIEGRVAMIMSQDIVALTNQHWNHVTRILVTAMTSDDGTTTHYISVVVG